MSINSRGTFAKIHHAHIRHNISLIRNRIGPAAFLCPMVKADAYGHGDLSVAKTLESLGVSAVGVVTIEEGAELRTSGLKLPILTFGVFDSDYAKYVIEHNLTPVISSIEQLNALKPLIKNRPLKIHLKFNTGMNRLGFKPEEALKLSQDLTQSHDGKFQVEGICTHFLNGEDADSADGYSSRQIKLFAMVQEAFVKHKPISHYLNSAATLVLSNTGIGSRPGISVYGISPLIRDMRHDLKPVMSIHSRIELLQRVRMGEVVSYGPQWKAKRDSIIGIVPIGYADGYFRGLTNKAEMIYQGMRVPVCGIVCMDYCMIDLTDAKQAPCIGDEVVVVGEQGGITVTISELAQKLNTIPYEILTRIGKRLNRVNV